MKLLLLRYSHGPKCGYIVTRDIFVLILYSIVYNSRELYQGLKYKNIIWFGLVGLTWAGRTGSIISQSNHQIISYWCVVVTRSIVDGDIKLFSLVYFSDLFLLLILVVLVPQWLWWETPYDVGLYKGKTVIVFDS